MADLKCQESLCAVCVCVRARSSMCVIEIFFSIIKRFTMSLSENQASYFNSNHNSNVKRNAWYIRIHYENSTESKTPFPRP